MRLLRKNTLLWVGMSLAFLLIGVGGALSWKQLLSYEAVDYGVELNKRLYQTFIKLDRETKKLFTPKLYKKLHGQEINRIPIIKVPEIQTYTQKVKKIIKHPNGAGVFFTNCPAKRQAYCYNDFVFEGENSHSDLEYYDPKGRPWFLATQTHTDWVLLLFSATKKTFPNYPMAWSIVFVKRFILGDIEKENGIWHALASPLTSDTSISSDVESSFPLLNTLFPEKKAPFEKFDIYFKSIRFPQSLIENPKDFNPECKAITDIKILHYTANVQCDINGELIQFLFTKKFDHPWQGLIIILFSLGLLFACFRFFRFIKFLQKQNIQKTIDAERGKLANAIGAKLVHDLKKGILSQLNRLYESDEKDYEHHYRYLDLLNKYINLLDSNLRREPEKNWVLFNKKRLSTYLDLTLGEVRLKTVRVEQSQLFFKLKLDKEVLLEEGPDWPNFYVPEMSFYRIIKNIIENYNVYGAEPLLITMENMGESIKLNAVNKIGKFRSKAKSTQLGVSIIKQLMVDNFGPSSQVMQEEKEGIYSLQICFLIEERP